MQNALVISPFATAPLDAGHRRRTWQMTKLLADHGYRVTFLLIAFEDPWYWRHDEDLLAELRAQWPEVILLYADRHIGAPPKSGELHHLDEWWDPTLEQMITNLTSRRFFDVAVVHNVWLSKAFDFLPSTTVKVLETHDLFWKRKEVFDRLGKKAEFFVISEEAEIFGIKRAHIAVTIQESEGMELIARTDTDVITVPFYDVTLEPNARPMNRTGYMSAGKVTFGTVASNNPFNVAGLNDLLREVERVVADTFAPVEVIVAGRVGVQIDKRAGVKCVGYVETEASFYDSVDFAITPVFDGTGFKVKMADALALRAPTLLSRHAAEGAVIDGSLICETAADMARRMAEIAVDRPPIADAMTHVRRARHELRERVRRGGENLLAVIAAASRPLVVDLTRASLKGGALALYSWLSLIRVFSARFPLVLLAAPEVVDAVGSYMPLGVKTMSAENFRRDRLWSKVHVIDVFGETDAETLGLTEDDVIAFDERWQRGSTPEGRIGALGEMPLLHKNATWEPTVIALRRKQDMARIDALRFAGCRTRIVVTDRPARLNPIEIERTTVTVFVALSEWENFQEAIFATLDGIVSELVWAAQPQGAAHRIAIEACAMKGCAFYGFLDGAAVNRGRDLGRSAIDNDKIAGRVVWGLEARFEAAELRYDRVTPTNLRVKV